MVNEYYSRKLLELKKQLDSGAITNDAYMQKMAAIKGECEQSDSSEYVPKFGSDMEMIAYLEALNGNPPKRRKKCQDSGSCSQQSL